MATDTDEHIEEPENGGEGNDETNQEEVVLDERIVYDESGEGTAMWIPLYIIHVPKKAFNKIYPYFAGAVFHRTHNDDKDIEIVKGKLKYIQGFLNGVDQYLEATEDNKTEDNSEEE